MLAIVAVLACCGRAGAALPPRPQEAGPYPVAVTLLDDGCDYDLDGTSLIWSDPVLGRGPELVVFSDEDFGAFDTRCPGNPAELVDMKLRVHYPGTGAAVAAGGPFPVVVILHGQQFADIPGYEGYDDLGRLLASHGYVVASIDGRSLLDATIKSRGEHVREHLRRLVARNAGGSGSIFEGALDLSRVSLIGHSRGGEAVVAAWEWQRVAPDPGYVIQAIVAIAPVQFFNRFPEEPSFAESMRDVAFQILQGRFDCDVSDFQGLRLYDRAADFRAPGETLKSMVYIDRANHNFFNSVWESEEGDDCGGSGRVLRGAKARAVAGAYIHAFLDTAVRAGTRFRPYLTGERRSPIGGTVTRLDFQAPSSEFLAIDHFEGVAPDPATNSLGGPVASSGIAGDEIFLDELVGYPGETRTGRLQWPARSQSASYESGFLSGLLPLPGALDHLSFRVGQIPYVLPPDRPTISMVVQLVDTLGNESAPVRVRGRLGLRGEGRIVLGGVRIPLAAFSGVQTDRPLRVRFRPGGSRSDDVVIDDLRYTR